MNPYLAIHQKSISKTKTFQYLFKPCINLYLSKKIIKSIEQLSIVNVYLHDSAAYNKDVTDQNLYILVKHNDLNFFKNLEELKKSNFYKGIYLVNKDYSIIIFKAVAGQAFENFIASKYSKMYNKRALDFIKDLFILNDAEEKEPEYQKEFLVMSGDDSYRKQVAESLDIKEHFIVELDSKLHFNEETINSNSLFYYD